jgi:hypothetical protein
MIRRTVDTELSEKANPQEKTAGAAQQQLIPAVMDLPPLDLG